VKMNRIDTAIMENFFALGHDAKAAAQSAGSRQR